jgi:hypothetical protein
MNLPEMMFEKTIARERPWWMSSLIGLMLFLIALIVGGLEFGLSDLLSGGSWRGVFLNPSIIFYILLIAPKLTKMENKVIDTFLSLGEMTEVEIKQVLEKSNVIKPFREVLAFGVGLIVIVIAFLLRGEISLSLLSIYTLIMSVIAIGLLSWTAYASVVTIRVIAQLIKQPLKVNLFNLDPFKVIGKTSLYLALAFIGGISLALIFTAPSLSVFQNLEFWIINLPILMIPVGIFFWNMYPTHKIIDMAKKKALRKVGHKISRVSDRLLNDEDFSSDAGDFRQPLQGLIALEERVEKVQTWPYDISTLRALMGSILIPVLTVFAQVLVRNWLGL